MNYIEKSERSLKEDRVIDYYKQIMLKEALRGELTSEELTDISDLHPNDYDDILSELCSDDTSFLDLYTLLQKMLSREFDHLFDIAKEDDYYDNDAMVEKHVKYSNLIDKSNMFLLKYIDNGFALESEDLAMQDCHATFHKRKIVPVLLRSPFLEDRSGILQ